MIIEGMTPDEFVIDLNNNFTDRFPESIVIEKTMTGIELEYTLNENFSKTESYVGQNGLVNKNNINNNFIIHNISLLKPTGLAIEWIDDFLRITFNDETSGTAQHEIWEKRDSGNYSLVHTLASGVETYDYYTWQNSVLKLRIRAKNGVYYSPFSTEETITTPLVIKTNQSILTQILINTLQVMIGETVNISWGDGTDNDYPAGTTSNITKDYASTNSCYFISFNNANAIGGLDWKSHTHIFGSIEKWRLPDYLGLFHFYGHTNITGDISNWVLPDTIGIFHVGSDDLSGDLTDWRIPDGCYDFRLDYNNFTGDLSGWTFPQDNGHTSMYFTCEENGFTGDISGWVFSPNMGKLKIARNFFTGDLSDWVIPVSLVELELTESDLETNSFTGDISGWVFPSVEVATCYNLWECYNIPFEGDLSGIGWGTVTKDIVMQFENANLTNLPRGTFAWMSIYDFEGNNCSQSEIDSLLSYIDTYFTGGVIPLTNCVYSLDGTGMSAPSSAGLASKLSIENKYIAVGKTVIIEVN